MHQRRFFLRLCGLALVLVVLVGTTGGFVHRLHDPANDNSCVVHVWAVVGKSASLTPVFQLPRLDTVIEHQFAERLEHRQPRNLPSTTARSPPLD